MNPALLYRLRVEADRSWVAHAVCRGMDPDLFFPGRGWPGNAEPAKRVCAGCPVREACADYAFETHEPLGVWGGLSERQRRARRKAWRERAA